MQNAVQEPFAAVNTPANVHLASRASNASWRAKKPLMEKAVEALEEEAFHATPRSLNFLSSFSLPENLHECTSLDRRLTVDLLELLRERRRRREKELHQRGDAQRAALKRRIHLYRVWENICKENQENQEKNQEEATVWRSKLRSKIAHRYPKLQTMKRDNCLRRV